MKTKSKSLSILAAAAAMLANAISASAAEVAYPAMTAAFDLTTTGTNTTGVIPLDPSGVFDGAYDFNGGDPIVTTRYYSGTIATTYNHAGWSTSNAVTVNFILANGSSVAGKIGIPDGGWGNMRSEFPDFNQTMDSVATPITFDYQIKLTSGNYGTYQMLIFTGPAAKAATEGIPAYTGGGNGPFTGSALSFVSFTTSGEVAGTASSSNFKSSDAWIPGEVVAGVVSDPYFTPVAGTYATASIGVDRHQYRRSDHSLHAGRISSDDGQRHLQRPADGCQQPDHQGTGRQVRRYRQRRDGGDLHTEGRYSRP